VNNQTLFNGSVALDPQAEIVELWRQAVLGDAAARRIFLQRIMPASALPALPVPIEFAPRPARRQQTRAAA
jgi:hypothetical protein